MNLEKTIYMVKDTYSCFVDFYQMFRADRCIKGKGFNNSIKHFKRIDSIEEQIFFIPLILEISIMKELKKKFPYRELKIGYYWEKDAGSELPEGIYDEIDVSYGNQISVFYSSDDFVVKIHKENPLSQYLEKIKSSLEKPYISHVS
tara:strand:+ start:807 stop:1244 length:438 start_codon:yes stop_codon:yes gene_type:complete